MASWRCTKTASHKEIEEPTPKELAKIAAESPLSGILDEEKKTESIKNLEKVMSGLDYDTYEGIEDVEGAIEEYRGIEKSGLSPEEYRDEKEAAFNAIEDAIESVVKAEIEEELE